MSQPSLRIATWNIQWKTRDSRAGQLMRERLLELDPEILCITEGYCDFLDGEGHLIEAEPDYGYPLVTGRRKVMLWSRHPWSEVERTGHPEMPSGRFVSGATETSVGEVTVVGVCIPWRDAHVSSGRRDRRPWQDHVAYLSGLESYLKGARERTIVVGDYNQKIPRTHAPQQVHAALKRCLGEHLPVATAGPLSPYDRVVIDHIANTSDLRPSRIATLSNVGPEGEALSDHLGVTASLSF